MMGIPMVSILYDRMTENRSHDNKWTEIDPFHAKFVIVLSTGQHILYNNFPHYYNLMDTLSSVRASPLKNKITFSSDLFWTNNCIDPRTVIPSFILAKYEQNNYFECFSNSYLKIINETLWDISKLPKLPYKILDSYAEF
jgi:hypothetical protein